ARIGAFLSALRSSIIFATVFKTTASSGSPSRGSYWSAERIFVGRSFGVNQKKKPSKSQLRERPVSSFHLEAHQFKGKCYQMFDVDLQKGKGEMETGRNLTP